MLEFEYVFRLLLAVFLGAIIGIERELIHRPAGLRTHMLVALGACLFMIISQKFQMDPARIAAGVVTGIGFVGAGTIIAERRRGEEIVHGVTTAASLWATAAVGLAIGVGESQLAIFTAVLVFIILWLRIFEAMFEEEKRLK
jgi:putative Mg2+ transporter-C (MgtC) family protein